MRKLLVTGLVVIGIYLAGAALSGSWSPLARRPLLDGTAGPIPYNWVNPPAALAATNKVPVAERSTDEIGLRGSQPGVFSTSDNQASLVLSEGAFPPAAGQTEITLDIIPVDPGTLGPPSPGLEASGNTYRFIARYQPSGREVQGLSGDATVNLVYPALSEATLSHPRRVLLHSVDGRTWTTLSSLDAPAVQQVTASITSLGYVEVAIASVSPSTSGPSTRPGPGGQGRDKTLLLTVVLVASLVVVVTIDVWLVLQLRKRPRRRSR